MQPCSSCGHTRIVRDESGREIAGGAQVSLKSGPTGLCSFCWKATPEGRQWRAEFDRMLGKSRKDKEEKTMATATASDTIQPPPGADIEGLTDRLADAIALYRKHGLERIKAALEGGAALAELKDALRHGDFGPHVERLGLGERTARRWMQLAESGWTAEEIQGLGGIKAAVQAHSAQRAEQRWQETELPETPADSPKTDTVSVLPDLPTHTCWDCTVQYECEGETCPCKGSPDVDPQCRSCWEAEEAKAAASAIRACRECGCTDDEPCSHDESGDTCFWVEEDLCDLCEQREGAGSLAPGSKTDTVSVLPSPPAPPSLPFRRCQECGVNTPRRNSAHCRPCEYRHVWAANPGAASLIRENERLRKEIKGLKYMLAHGISGKRSPVAEEPGPVAAGMSAAWETA